MSEQQREYFRIRCDAVLGVERITIVEERATLDAYDAGNADSFGLASRFAAQSRDTGALLRRIEEHNPDVAEYLDVLEQRLELMARLLLQQQHFDPGDATQQSVELSATGIGFEHGCDHRIGGLVRFRMLLLPTYLGVELLGRITRCEPAADGIGYALGAHFEHMREAERELIIAHILERQGAQLRRLRIARD